MPITHTVKAMTLNRLLNNKERRDKMIQYDSWLTVEASRKLAKRLRGLGEYKRVKIGSYIIDEGKKYSKVYVER